MYNRVLSTIRALYSYYKIMNIKIILDTLTISILHGNSLRTVLPHAMIYYCVPK